MIRPTENRPVFLDLMKIQLPLAGRVSILHRLTGLLLIGVIPLALYLLSCSLSGPAGYDHVRGLLDSWLAQALLLMLLWAFFHHFWAGIRYLLIDIDRGVSREAMRPGARLVLIAGPVTALLVWVLLP